MTSLNKKINNKHIKKATNSSQEKGSLRNGGFAIEIIIPGTLAIKRYRFFSKAGQNTNLFHRFEYGGTDVLINFKMRIEKQPPAKINKTNKNYNWLFMKIILRKTYCPRRRK